MVNFESFEKSQTGRKGKLPVKVVLWGKKHSFETSIAFLKEQNSKSVAYFRPLRTAWQWDVGDGLSSTGGFHSEARQPLAMDTLSWIPEMSKS